MSRRRFVRLLLCVATARGRAPSDTSTATVAPRSTHPSPGGRRWYVPPGEWTGLLRLTNEDEIRFTKHTDDKAGVEADRYFALVDGCGPSREETWMYARVGHNVDLFGLAVSKSRDGGLTFSAPERVARRVAQLTAPNFGILESPPPGSGSVADGPCRRPLVLVGGLDQTSEPKKQGRHHIGVRALELASATDAAPTANTSAAPVVLRGAHRGCIEGRARFTARGGACEFDGRASVVFFRGRYLAFVRANLAMGSRFVQVAEAAPGAELLRGALDWGPLRPLRIDGFSPAAAGRPDDMNNLYFLAAHVLPRERGAAAAAGGGGDDALVALLPVVDPHAAPHAAVCVCFSRDGRRWTRLRALSTAAVMSGRLVDHPAMGVLVRGSTLHFFVQRFVPGIPLANGTPIGRSALIRYGVALAELRALAAAELARLETSGGLDLLDNATDAKVIARAARTPAGTWRRLPRSAVRRQSAGYIPPEPAGGRGRRKRAK